MNDDELRDALRADLYRRWKDRLRDLEQNPARAVVARRRRLWKRIGGFAAALLLLAVGTWWLTPTNSDRSPRQLAQAYFEPPLNTIAPTERGRRPVDSAALALYYYDAGQYEQAVAVWEALATQGPLASDLELYRGVAYLEAERPADAVATLRATPHELAPWYLALAYLRSEDAASAKSLLERLSAPGSAHPCAEKAARLLKELE